MTVNPFVIERFGGLNLADDPLEVGTSGALGIADVDFDRLGRIRTRNGYTSVKQLTFTNALGLGTFENTFTTRQFVAAYLNGGTKTFAAYASSGGAAVASTSAPSATSTNISYARIGTPGNEYLYIANGDANGEEGVWRWTGAAFSQPAGMPNAWYLTVKPNSNRLVSARASTVAFSDAGLPETWTSTSTLDLTPGDGSNITGLATFQNNVYVFKRRRFFVFGTESIASNGQPIFNYRAIDGYGAIVPPVAGDEGVYFFDGRSVWVTADSVPQRVSRPIEPALRAEAALAGVANGTVDSTNLLKATLSYALGRLYLSVIINSGDRVVFVFDPKVGQWTVYLTDLKYFAALRRASTDQEYAFAFGSIVNTGGVWYQDPTVYEDFAGLGVIHWYHITGHYAIGPPERVTVAPSTAVVGGPLDGLTSSVTVGLTTDTMTTSGSASFSGSTGQLGDYESWAQNVDCEGRRWKTQISGSGGVYIARVVHEVSFVKPGGVS